MTMAELINVSSVRRILDPLSENSYDVVCPKHGRLLTAVGRDRAGEYAHLHNVDKHPRQFRKNFVFA